MASGRAKKRAIVHAGLPKTATTTIQNACFEARMKLHKGAGILYPGNHPDKQQALRTIFVDDPRKHPSNMLAERTDLAELRREGEQILGEFKSEIEQSDAESVLFSNEGLSNHQPGELVKLKDWLSQFFDDIEVLFVVREPVAYTTSAVQQLLKQGHILEAKYSKPPRPLYQSRIGRVMKVFGAGAVQVLTFEEMCGHADGVIGSFLDYLGVANQEVRKAVHEAARRDNSSLSNEAALILSSLNAHRPLFVDGRTMRNRSLYKEVSALRNIKGDKFRLPKEVAERIFEMTRPDVAWLRENFGIEAYDNIDFSKYTNEPSLKPEVAQSLALTISDLINKQRTTFDPDRGAAKVVSGKLRKIDHWLSGNLPGLRRWYR
ncbi:MAG: hypothetical protein APF80_08475 [Alphaproteobacteria bacterium BRH_c36]|nr:MAG: hypothetical protein APF80_08475 [Alphaproteobacteria bacterium BRH_c36]